MENTIHKKWIVYNTEIITDKIGWNVVIDSYILDFEDSKKLYIKDIGEKQIESIEYLIKKDVILNSNEERIYLIKKLEENLLILEDIMSNTFVYLYPLQENQLNIDSENLFNYLLNKEWMKEENSIVFLNEKYLIADEIETDYKIFFEENNQIKMKNTGFWRIDNYKSIFLIELYSQKSKHKAIYQILKLDKDSLIAISKDKNGNELLIKWNSIKTN
ncbi:HpaA family protein [Flavobacterium sp. I3-2]|uniref:HpaA family protein n=1 Tax=Flavobacterium sp. I3-2 TaxID=2748319 RepID=UPI001C49DE26|nr:HpaA family protein [Flavobacterium sp. I3-2]